MNQARKGVLCVFWHLLDKRILEKYQMSVSCRAFVVCKSFLSRRKTLKLKVEFKSRQKEKKMLVQKLRLQRGWSQQQLAELSGLNVRTIQRIEKGQEPSVESLKSLAAVFNVDFSTLKEQGMENVINESQSAEEILAFNQVRKLKGFYIHLAQYVLSISLLSFINLFYGSRQLWVHWVIIGWGFGVLFHWLQVSDRYSFFGSKWEKEQVEKRLGRKL